MVTDSHATDLSGLSVTDTPNKVQPRTADALVQSIMGQFLRLKVRQKAMSYRNTMVSLISYYFETLNEKHEQNSKNTWILVTRSVSVNVSILSCLSFLHHLSDNIKCWPQWCFRPWAYSHMCFECLRRHIMLHEINLSTPSWESSLSINRGS